MKVKSMIKKHETFTLTNAVVLTMDDRDTFFREGNIVVSGGRIKEIGSAEEVAIQGEPVDMSDKLLLPGLINTHTHSPSPLFRGMADDLTLMDWLKKLIWPAERHLTGDLAYWGASLSFLEFLEAGITTFADQYFFSGWIAQAALQSGLRAFIAPTVFAGPSPETEQTLQVAVDFIEKYKGKEAETRIYPCIGPHAPYSVSDEDFKTVVEIAAANKLLIHTHISETADENKQIYAETGLTPTQYLDSLGVLDQRVLAAHCIHLTPGDLEIFREKKVAVTYNPVSNLKLVSGIMPLKEMLAQGITVSIGTDGAQSNNSLDLLRDLKTGALIQKQHVMDPTFFPAREALRMATIEGAKVLGMEGEIGSLEQGKLADIIALDLSVANLRPLHRDCLTNLYSAVVYSASGLNVADVLVGGEFLLRNRLTQRVNRQEIIIEAERGARYIMEKAGLL